MLRKFIVPGQVALEDQISFGSEALHGCTVTPPLPGILTSPRPAEYHARVGPRRDSL